MEVWIILYCAAAFGAGPMLVWLAIVMVKDAKSNPGGGPWAPRTPPVTKRPKD